MMEESWRRSSPESVPTVHFERVEILKSDVAASPFVAQNFADVEIQT